MLTVPEMAERMGVSDDTVRVFAREGLMRALRTNNKGDILVAPPEGSLQKKQPGKKLKQPSVFPKLQPQIRNEVQYET